MSWMLRAYFDTNVYERGSWLADMPVATQSVPHRPEAAAPREALAGHLRPVLRRGRGGPGGGLRQAAGVRRRLSRPRLGGLAPVPAVRLCVGVCQSQIYAQVVGTPGQPDVRRPDPADGYDVWHAILALTGRVFLTLDRRLAADVERVPDIGVRVARSAGDLLAMVAALPRGGRQL